MSTGTSPSVGFFFFFFFGKNMTFGYYFSPNGAKLATGWNGFESNWLKCVIFSAKD
jgi:hypothetical protein